MGLRNITLTPTGEYKSPIDFTATYKSNVTVTISGAPFATEDASCFVEQIIYKPSAGNWTKLNNGENGVSMTITGGVITVTGAGTPFAENDLYRITISAGKKGYDTSTGTELVTVINPLSENYVVDTLEQTATVVTGSYLLSMDGFKNLSLSGSLLDADGTLTVTVTAMNNPDDTVAAEYTQIYGYDPKNNTTVNSMTVTNGILVFLWDFDNLNYTWVKVNITAAISNTVSLYARRTY